MRIIALVEIKIDSADLETKLDQINTKLDKIIKQGKIEMAEIDDLKAAVAAEETVEAGVVTLLTELTDKINGLVQNATDLAQLKSDITNVTSQVTSDSQSLSDAVVANTPAA